MQTLNDEPTLLDRLQRKKLLSEVGRVIATCQPPQVFAIHGDWGMGKTSFLHQVQLYLTGQCPQAAEAELKQARDHLGKTYVGQHPNTVVVWFEAWRYEHEKAPVVALLHEMRSQLAWYVRLKTEAGKLAHVAIRGALLSLEDLTKKIGFQASKIEQAGREWEEQHLAVALPSHTIREHLERAIGELLPEKKRRKYDSRLVVLIDDLDRCESKAAYRLLEGLKIYLTLPNCVFVLGMNQRVVEEGIGQALKIEPASLRAERAAAYLEKLCQNLWRLPSVERPERLLLQWLPDEPWKSWVQEALGLRFVQGGKTLEPACLPRNPRRIKGLANLLRRMAIRIPVGGPKPIDPVYQAKLLLIVASIHQFHQDLFRRWESEPELYRFLLEWVDGYDHDLEFLKRLKRPYAISIDEKTPTRTTRIEEAFPDPEERNVFWIQPLIHQLGEVPEKDFAPYLHG